MPLHDSMSREGYRYMKSVCAVAVLGSRPREVNSSAGCQLLNTRVYCFLGNISGLLTDGTNSSVTTESLDSTILHRIHIGPQGHINHFLSIISFSKYFKFARRQHLPRGRE